MDIDRQARATIFDIQRFSIHDGPGIRTTVFMKGCPLRCLWCHNPESYTVSPQVAFSPDLCIGCGYCLRVCPAGAHRMEGEEHVLDREKCQGCFVCAQECYSGALEVMGREITVCDALDEVLRDRSFYEESGGGLTLSGGEPMLQFAFTFSLLSLSHETGINNCLETCGIASGDNYREVLPLVDTFLMDWKETDSAKHRDFTGQGNEKIRENMKLIDSLGGSIILRCPIIPEFNLRDDHLRGIAELSQELKNCAGVQVMGYHRLGDSKRARLGLPPQQEKLANITDMTEAEVQDVIDRISELGGYKVSTS